MLVVPLAYAGYAAGTVPIFVSAKMGLSLLPHLNKVEGYCHLLEAELQDVKLALKYPLFVPMKDRVYHAAFSIFFIHNDRRLQFHFLIADFNHVFLSQPDYLITAARFSLLFA
jgi:hypothetical protein